MFLCAALLTLPPARGQSAAAATSRPSDAGVEAALTVPDSLGWISFGTVQTGFGFRDNVLLSHAGEERSGFVRSGLDATVWRVPRARVDYLAVVSAAGTRYFSAQTVNQEAQAIVLTEWRYRIGDGFKFSLGARGYYFDQIYDVSNTDLQQVVAEVKTSGVSAGPTVRWGFRPSWWIEAQADGKRETFPDGLNNRGIREGTVRLGWRPGTRIEASISGTERRRDYDRREQYSVSGRPLIDTILKVAEREGEVRLDVTLDAAGRWKTSTRASTLRYLDNGSGYLNYRHRRIAHEIEWTAGDWFVALEAAARRVEYETQTVGLGLAPPARIRDDFSAQVRVERKLGPRWTAYAEYIWERNRCNDALASYSLNEGLLGVRWNWEK